MITLPTLRQRLDEDPAELERLVNVQIVRLTGEKNARDADLILSAFKHDLPKNYPWPGNVRELEQAVRRVLLTHHYTGDMKVSGQDPDHAFAGEIHSGNLTARDLLSRYCVLLYNRFGTMEDVARRTGLDRRTVKKHILSEEETHGKRGARSHDALGENA